MLASIFLDVDKSIKHFLHRLVISKRYTRVSSPRKPREVVYSLYKPDSILPI